ncbi:MAG: sugar phosphate isomerase/epimerase [Bacteroidetes bacterium]|nr:sugar phosphate isomerase/epimerase [Bacteroidota bacterium]
MDQFNQTKLSRRKFWGAAVAATGALALKPFVSESKIFKDSETIENSSSLQSKEGLQIGAITYSFRDMKNRSVQDILQYCKDSGITSIEFMGGAAEVFAGIPGGNGPDANTVERNIESYHVKNIPGTTTVERNNRPPFDYSKMTIGASGGWGSLPGNEEQRKWRKSVPMTKFEECRKLFNDAGVEIHMLKVSPATWTDDEVDYAFRMGKALGAKALSDELDWVEGGVPRLAKFAEKHDMFVAFHLHQQFGFPSFSIDPYLAASPAIMISFDIGHYYGATGQNPCVFLEKYHDRIFNCHLKDKTGPKTTPANTNFAWGQGETPIKDVLLLLQKHSGEKGWPRFADIELEYPVQPWSDAVNEVKKCNQFANAVLKCGM